MPPKVKDYIDETLVTVNPNDNLAHLRNLMIRYRDDKALVVEEGKLVGIISMTDIVKIYSSPSLYRRSLDSILVKEIMSTEPVTIKANASVEDAARVMVKKGIASLPVVDDHDSVIGVLAKKGVLKAIIDAGLNTNPKVMEAGDLDPPRAHPFHTIFHVAEILESKPYKKVVVVDNNVPIGVIGRRDIVFLEPATLLRRIDQPYMKRDAPLPKGRTGGIRTYLVPVAMDIMSRDPVLVNADNSVLEAAYSMLENDVSFLPIVDERDNLVGGISALHILALYTGLSV